MRLAAISDIHGNLFALDAVIEDLKTLGGVDILWVLGDLAALGTRPAECVQRVRDLHTLLGMDEKNVRVIGGNTDRYLVNGVRMRTASAKDAEALKKLAENWRQRDDILNWNTSQLTFEDYEFLKKIRNGELSLEVADYGYVIGYHGAPGDDEQFLNPDTPAEQVLDALLDREGRLGIGAHTHVPMDRDLGRWRAVNIGSVGMAVNPFGQAQWGCFTFENGTVTVDLRTTPFDREAALADLQTSGYPHPDWALTHLRPQVV